MEDTMKRLLIFSLFLTSILVPISSHARITGRIISVEREIANRWEASTCEEITKEDAHWCKYNLKGIPLITCREIYGGLQIEGTVTCIIPFTSDKPAAETITTTPTTAK
jgi:hypothetical protein